MSANVCYIGVFPVTEIRMTVAANLRLSWEMVQARSQLLADIQYCADREGSTKKTEYCVIEEDVYAYI